MTSTEMFKKVIYTGVGVVTTATERVKKSIDELNVKSEEAEVEGKKVVEDFVDDVKNRSEKVSDGLKKTFDKILNQFDFPNRTEAETLNARIAELEEKLQATKATAVKTVKRTVKKATTTK